VIFGAGIEDEDMVEVFSDEFLVVLMPWRDVAANGKVWFLAVSTRVTFDEFAYGTMVMPCVAKGDAVFDQAEKIYADVCLVMPEVPCLEGVSATKIEDRPILGDDLGEVVVDMGRTKAFGINVTTSLVKNPYGLFFRMRIRH